VTEAVFASRGYRVDEPLVVVSEDVPNTFTDIVAGTPHALEFMLVDNPAHPGEFFPRTSGMRFRYDSSRSRFDLVTAIELGDLDHGYTPIDISGKDERLYSVTSPLYAAMIIVAIPTYSKGALPLTAKHKDGTPLTSRVEAVEAAPRASTPYLLPPRHTVDQRSVAATSSQGALKEVKEWQALMDHLRRLPVKGKGELPVFPLDERAREVRAIKAG